MPSLFLYSIISTLAAVTVLNYAVITREEFYPIVVYLSTSKLSLAVLLNFFLMVLILVGKFIQTIFLGQLRVNEIERVNESLRYTIPEIAIALTIFREELNLRVVSIFGLLLFSKFFHVIMDERMNYIEGNNAGE
jgi:E3 ubiquitin-protein ligase synoviolin